MVLWHRAIPVLDEQEDPGSHGEWTDDVTESARAAGGSVWLRVGSTLAIVFEMHDIKAALDWGLETLQRADQVDHSVVGMRIAFGVA
ncbi:MAG: hypothetical protein KC668_31515, partial [Myxococcales bacterium]|nr:hypothetical protein [Myxococcales bacterium]